MGYLNAMFVGISKLALIITKWVIKCNFIGLFLIIFNNSIVDNFFKKIMDMTTIIIRDYQMDG